MPYTTPPAAGSKLVGSELATLLQERQTGQTYWGNRTTTSTSTTSEGGVLRLDNVEMKAGRQYLLMTSTLWIDTSTANDEAFAQLRINTSGTATTSSTLVPGSTARVRLVDAGFPESRTIIARYAPSSDVAASILLTVGRSAGSGNITLDATSGAIDLMVVDTGPAVTDTGTDI